MVYRDIIAGLYTRLLCTKKSLKVACDGTVRALCCARPSDPTHGSQPGVKVGRLPSKGKRNEIACQMGI